MITAKYAASIATSLDERSGDKMVKFAEEAIMKSAEEGMRKAQVDISKFNEKAIKHAMKELELNGFDVNITKQFGTWVLIITY